MIGDEAAGILLVWREQEKEWAGGWPNATVSRRNHSFLSLYTINATGVRLDLARSQPATGEIHYPCSYVTETGS